MTSEVESFSTRNFVTFPNIKCRIGKNFFFEICFLGHVIWPYLESGHHKKCQNFDINAHNI